MAQAAGKNPYAAVWAQAEASLIYRINAVHNTGVDVDRARDNLHWSGGSADRFRARAHTRHEQLQQHNDLLRHLLTLVRQAAEVKMPAPTTQATT